MSAFGQFGMLAAALAPVFLLMALGRFIFRRRLISEPGAADLAQVVYWVALPARLCWEAARTDVRAAFDLRALLAAAGAYAGGLAIAWMASGRLDPAARGSVLNGAARANGAFVGLPVITLVGLSLPAEVSAPLGSGFAVLLGTMVLVFNVGSVLAFRLPHHGLGWPGLRAAVAEIPRNPIVIGCTLGVCLGLWRPGCLVGTVPGHAIELVGAAAVPLALLVTGARCDASAFRTAPRLLAWTTAAKLLLVPAVAWGLCWLLGVGPVSTLAAVVLMACPAAMASTPMARLLGGDERLMAALVTASTVLAPASLLIWLWLLT